MDHIEYCICYIYICVPSGYSTYPWKQKSPFSSMFVDDLPFLKIVMFHSYVKLPEGIYTGRQKGHSIIYYVLLLYNSNIEYVMGFMINNFGLYINYIEHRIYI